MYDSENKAPKILDSASCNILFSFLSTRRSKCYQKRCLSHFTMVELLVTIGIIMILASILFPALSKAKEYARKTTCKNNLHQWGIGLQMYGSDHGNWLPPTGSDNYPYSLYNRMYWKTEMKEYIPYGNDYKNNLGPWGCPEVRSVGFIDIIGYFYLGHNALISDSLHCKKPTQITNDPNITVMSCYIWSNHTLYGKWGSHGGNGVSGANTLTLAGSVSWCNYNNFEYDITGIGGSFRVNAVPK